MKINHILVFLFFTVITSTVFSQDLSFVYKKVNPAVVEIFTLEQKLKAVGGVTEKVLAEGLGSGFMISETDIVTAAHVVNAAQALRVKFLDGDVLPAQVLYTFKTADIALIRLDTPKNNAVTVAFGDSDLVEIGAQVFIVGAPFGYGHSLSSGYISGVLKNEHSSNPFTRKEFFQTDAAINTGNSGGPMFNMKGEVIGVVSQILTKSGGFEGIGFAATANITKDLLMNNSRPWMGLDGLPLTLKTAKLFNVPQNSGLLVQRVVNGSVLDKMGLRGGDSKAIINGEELIIGGDIILSFNAIEFDVTDPVLISLSDFFKNLKSEDPFTITILRGGEKLKLFR